MEIEDDDKGHGGFAAVSQSAFLPSDRIASSSMTTISQSQSHPVAAPSIRRSSLFNLPSSANIEEKKLDPKTSTSTDKEIGTATYITPDSIPVEEDEDVELSAIPVVLVPVVEQEPTLPRSLRHPLPLLTNVLQRLVPEEHLLPTLGLLTFFSALGVLIRVTLVAALTYSSAAVFPLIWAQVLGCLIMGMALQRRKEIMDFYSPLYTGITTGLCGSITTFSSFIILAFKNLGGSSSLNKSDYHTTKFTVVTSLQVIFITFMMGTASVNFGQTLSKCFPSITEDSNRETTQPQQHQLPQTTSQSSSLQTSSTTPLKRDTPNRRQNQLQQTTSLTLTHIKLKPPIALILGLLGLSPSSIVVGVIVAVSDGFCGCLTTLSTMAVELNNLPTGYAFLYGFISVVVSQILVASLVFPFAVPS
ncbi:hypothetical protein HDU76_000933 [Blyttiomyces sp. JEL0837]|nr:hypothetical protein HDU76_000933 [Blyttiomyces sp. JEL0837]